MKHASLEEMLVNDKIITQAQLEEVNLIQKETGQATFYIILDHQFAKEKEVLRVLAKSLKMDFVDNLINNINSEVIRSFPQQLALKYKMCPLRVHEGTLTLATSNPFNITATEDISMLTGLAINTVLSTKVDIELAIDRLYTKRSEKNELGEDIANEGDEAENEATVETSSVVRVVNNLIIDAYKVNASDIHIEPEANFTRVRFRVDGDLMRHIDFDKEKHSLISTRIKILAGLNIAEKRLPQDGSFQFNHDFKKIDIRVSTLPTPYGENIVMRLLGADQNIEYSLSGLGISPTTVATIEKAIRVPHGIILVTGPTGSGKTTTLYSILAKLAVPTKAIKTVEDPIERKFEGITQVQVNQKAGLTFAAGLRSILRQDPDIIMIGEIRDTETAEIAIRSAITGHLVLSTIHTNDALSSVIRLVDMGIEPFKVGSSLVCIISQRLVKKICIHCKKKVDLSTTEARLLATDLTYVYEGAGCPKCNNTGYSGRLAVFETVLVDGHLEDLISRGASLEDLRNYAKEKKIPMLRDEVMSYVQNGTTTVEEALRILYNVEN
ncbi:MAG: Type II secretory pathway ATPase PulE/Tfp pilus assembly pathway ATPase PilB [Erysipelotrichaceae bacterium]|nr:MAG: Type II secretory pathway ATPase PulE/Tfp pilus assembly pathway ATPase [Erysipelotrichaceae bacterium]TXT16294.1 MAG: Type II secretory pathway ATPase PulE/Tfp pilus assembly pathway ATPase PilB [Erysipelotrichaceae bacterium]